MGSVCDALSEEKGVSGCCPGTPGRNVLERMSLPRAQVVALLRLPGAQFQLVGLHFSEHGVSGHVPDTEPALSPVHCGQW